MVRFDTENPEREPFVMITEYHEGARQTDIVPQNGVVDPVLRPAMVQLLLDNASEYGDIPVKVLVGGEGKSEVREGVLFEAQYTPELHSVVSGLDPADAVVGGLLCEKTAEVVLLPNSDEPTFVNIYPAAA